MPHGWVMVLAAMTAWARWSGHGGWWMSARSTAQEPDGRDAVHDVGADIELGKAREHRDRRSAAGLQAGDPKRGDPDPGGAVEGVEWEGGRDGRPKNVEPDRPVRRTASTLTHGPWPGRARAMV